MIDKLINIVEKCAQLMVGHDFSTIQKDGYANIVTSLDMAVQSALKERLAKLLPGSGFLCEEEDRHDLCHEYVWVIDPIDGTVNFSRGVEQCAVSVGLHHNGRMEMGVVCSPFTGETFAAVRGQGATRNGEPISVSQRPFANAIMCAALPVYHKEHAKESAAVLTEVFLRGNDLRRFGTAALELCYLAMGRYELYFEYLLSPWDFAAASLILSEAGGVATDLGGKPLDTLAPTGVIAANNAANLAVLADIVARNVTVANN